MTFFRPVKTLAKLPPNLRVLCLTGFIEGIVALGPLWSLYIDELHGSLATLGLMLSLASFFSSAFQIPGGMLTDYAGRKKALIFGGLIRVGSLIYIGSVSDWKLLLPAIVVSSLAGALIGPAKSAMIAESIGAQDRGKAFGLVDTIQSLTMIIGPALGLFIAGKASIKVVFYASAALSALALFFSIRYLTETRPGLPAKFLPVSLNRFWPGKFLFSENGHLNVLLISQGMTMMAASFAAPFFTLFANKEIHVPKEKLAWIFFANEFLLLLTRIPMGYLADHPRIKNKYLLVWGCVWGALIWVLVSYCHTYWQLFAYALIAFAFVLPARSTLLAEMTSPTERGSVFGMLSAMDGIAGTVGYALSGLFAQKYGMRLSMQVAGIGLLASGTFIAAFFREARKGKTAA